jgi:hypothetical protein
MAEYEVRYDPAKHRLYLKLAGFFKESEALMSLAALEQELATTTPGFDVVADLSRFLPASPSAAVHIRRAAELVKTSGRRRAVRIASRLVTAMMQLNRELKGMFDEDTIRYASSLEEAEEILDSWE